MRSGEPAAHDVSKAAMSHIMLQITLGIDGSSAKKFVHTTYSTSCLLPLPAFASKTEVIF